MENNSKKVNLIINTLYAACIVVIVIAAIKLFGYIYPFFIAFLLVGMVQPLTRFINKKLKISKKVLSLIIMILLYLTVGTAIFFILWALIDVLKSVFVGLPVWYKNDIAPFITSVSNWFSSLPLKLPDEFTISYETFNTGIMNALQGLLTTISQSGVAFIGTLTNSVPSGVMSVIFTILLSIFISLNYTSVSDFLEAQLPASAHDAAVKTKYILKNSIFKYVKAYLILMAVTFVELSVGLLVLGIDNPIGKAAGIAIFDALPLFGTGGIMIPWVILVLISGDFPLAIGIAVLYGIVTLIRNIIEPKVVGDQLGINPVVSLMAIYLGFRLAGVIGMIVFPILAQILITLHSSGAIRLYREKPKKEEPEPTAET